MRAIAQLIALLGISCLDTGCLRAGFALPSLEGGSAAGDGSAVARADGGAQDGSDASCSPAWRCAFTLEPPSAVAVLNSAERECDPVLSADCLDIYFGSFRAGGLGEGDIWTAHRASSALPFAAPTLYPAFNTTLTEQRLIFTRDGLQAFLTSYRSGGRGASDIWTATRTSTTASFGALVNVTALNTAQNEYDVFLSADGLRLYFDVSSSSGDEELMVATRPSLTATFSTAAVPLSSLNSSADDGNATFSADELFVVFTSNRAGTAGTSDLWYAKRASTSEPFGTPQRLPVVNTSLGELEPFLACGDQELWFVVQESGPVDEADWDIYRSRFIAP